MAKSREELEKLSYEELGEMIRIDFEADAQEPDVELILEILDIRAKRRVLFDEQKKLQKKLGW